MKIAVISDKGRKRENNEDSYFINKKIKFAIVADGMGGHQAGEKASKLCVQLISEAMENDLKFIKDENKLKDFMKKTILKMNDEIYNKSTEDHNLKGMGTTLSFIYKLDNKILYSNVGDSRIYLIRNNEIEQITLDDSVVAELISKGEITREEVKNHPLRHMITKAIGTTKGLVSEIQFKEYQKMDYFLLCTDGLTDMLEDDDILNTVIKNKRPHKICKELVRKANENGGNDNITAVVIFME